MLPAEPVLVTLKQPGDGGRAGGPVIVRVEPGGEAVLVAVVRNQSGIVDNYDLRVGGWPEEWWTVSPQTVHLVRPALRARRPSRRCSSACTLRAPRRPRRVRGPS